MAVHHQRAVIILEPPVDSSEIPKLCTQVRTLLADVGVAGVTCDVRLLTQCDVTLVDALARMQLTARQLGRSICLLHAAPELDQILTATGLADVLPISQADEFPDSSPSEPCTRPRLDVAEGVDQALAFGHSPGLGEEDVG